MQMENLAHRRVGELVAQDFRRAGVFSRYGIDFCCGGGISLSEACRRGGLDVEEVARELVASTESPRGIAQHRFDHWSPSFLIDYIVNEHHSFVKENIPVIRAFTQKVARVHGGARPELVRVAQLFNMLAEEMEQHMEAEETVVFPRIQAGPRDGASLHELIDQMEDDHSGAGGLMREIRDLTHGFQPPEGACNTYRAAFVKLEEFEADLHVHVHLENNVLFPKALEAEATGLGL